MKKLFVLMLMAFSMATGVAKAQNLQVMYDAGRGCVTSTVEMFRPDSFGSTYFFVDLDYTPKVTGAYWEIAREFCFWQDTDMYWLSAHIEYDGGMNTFMSFNNNWLVGATYSGHSADFSKTWSLSAMYKAMPGYVGSAVHTFQITGVWGISFAKGWCDFSGFFDYWIENNQSVFISEPQFWVNLNKIKGMEKVNLSLGGEVELSVNFGGMTGFHALPAVGAKWTF